MLLFRSQESLVTHWERFLPEIKQMEPWGCFCDPLRNCPSMKQFQEESVTAQLWYPIIQASADIQPPLSWNSASPLLPSALINDFFDQSYFSSPSTDNLCTVRLWWYRPTWLLSILKSWCAAALKCHRDTLHVCNRRIRSGANPETIYNLHAYHEPWFRPHCL